MQRKKRLSSTIRAHSYSYTLTKPRPTMHVATQVEHIIRELKGQPDRAVGVLGGAIVDDAITAGLTALWRNDSQNNKLTLDTMNALVGAGGGTLTFGIKLQLAYISKLIGPKMYADLKSLKDVRNKFAHNLLMPDSSGHRTESVTFKTQRIVTWCRDMKLIDEVDIVLDGMRLPTKKPRERFLAMTVMCHCAFALYGGNPTKQSKFIDNLLHR